MPFKRITRQMAGTADVALGQTTKRLMSLAKVAAKVVGEFGTSDTVVI
jgi:hypothetical protein